VKPEDLEVSDICERKVGGQQAGSPRSIIKVLHKPTGIYAVCDFERSQHANRTAAMAMVEYGLAHIKWKDR
jgi:peptide chain release factor 2